MPPGGIWAIIACLLFGVKPYLGVRKNHICHNPAPDNNPQQPDNISSKRSTQPCFFKTGKSGVYIYSEKCEGEIKRDDESIFALGAIVIPVSAFMAINLPF